LRQGTITTPTTLTMLTITTTLPEAEPPDHFGPLRLPGYL